jgi:hypothetical protein
MMCAPGGKTVAGAVADAEKELRSLEADCLNEVDLILADLTQTYAGLADPLTSDQVKPFYQAALRLVGPASVAGLPVLGRVAYSLCDLTDRMDDTGALVLEPITVHMNALTLLRQQRSLPADVLREIGAGLSKIREKYGGEPSPRPAA